MYGCIDRFEEDLVVVNFEDEDMTVDLPRAMFPDNIQEGDYVKFQVTVDEDKTAQAYEEARKLLEL